MDKRAKTILFFAEAVTLAHVARPMVLASSLSSDFDVHFASAANYLQLFDVPENFTMHDLYSISSAEFTRKLKKGSPLYNVNTLQKYVENDLKIIESVKPDIIVGDFRLSLAVSANKLNIPYINISNAYWSPRANLKVPVPDIPLVKITGEKIAQKVFDIVRPIAFALHAKPLNKLRNLYNLPELGNDMREAYTYANHTLYADIPSLVSLVNPLETEHFIGPINWEPRIPLPDWWDTLPQDKPIVYVTMGSSGHLSVLKKVVDILSEMDVTAMISTVKKDTNITTSKNIFVSQMLPGSEACKRADLVICNGGSPTSYQALSAGKPVIGIASNLDQYLNMTGINHNGAGVSLRAGALNVDLLEKIVKSILSTSTYQNKAINLQKDIGQYKATDRFAKILKQIA